MRQVLDYIRQQRLIEKGDHVVVGLSGGADSVCLFFVLYGLREEIGFTMSAVHVNHNLRGDEALRDEAFVRELCETHGISLGLYSYDVKKMAADGKISVEEAGRSARRQAFAAYCKEHGGTKTALAHHQDDLAETMLHHLSRGTGLDGLAALRPVRDGVIRPLLCMNRAEIEHYLKSRHIEYVTDTSNESDAYTRNKIRHHVVDYLVGEVNPGTVPHMAETAAELRELQDYLEREAEEALRSRAERCGDGLYLKDEAAALHPALLGQALRMCIGQVSGELRNITREHIRMVRELFHRQTGKEIRLPGGVLVQRGYGGLYFGRERENTAAPADVLTLEAPGIFHSETMEIRCTLEPNRNRQIPEKTYTKWLNYDKIKGDLVFRTRRQGDYLVINRDGGKKKLKDLFIDLKIPRENRDQIRLLAVGSEVLWVCGYRLSEAYKVLPETKDILKIQIRGGIFHE